MVTSAGPACDHCHHPFAGQPCIVSFSFTQFRYCGRRCLIAAEEERSRRWRAAEYSLQRHRRRHWKVIDGNGDLVCVTLYKRGAEEVIRRLRGHTVPASRSVPGTSAAKSIRAPIEHPIEPSYRQKACAKAA